MKKILIILAIILIFLLISNMANAQSLDTIAVKIYEHPVTKVYQTAVDLAVKNNYFKPIGTPVPYTLLDYHITLKINRLNLQLFFYRENNHTKTYILGPTSQIKKERKILNRFLFEVKNNLENKE